MIVHTLPLLFGVAKKNILFCCIVDSFFSLLYKHKVRVTHHPGAIIMPSINCYDFCLYNKMLLDLKNVLF